MKILGVTREMLLDQEASESTTFKPSFSDPPSRIFLGHCLGIINTSAESSAQAQSIGTLFEQIGSRGGSVDMSKSQARTHSGAGRGVSQANEAAINPKLTGLWQHDIVEF